MNALALVFPLAFFFQAPPAYTVAGTVVDSVKGIPLAKARVSLGGVAAVIVTGPDGKFRFTGVRAGTHQLAAERIGYARTSFAQHSASSTLSTGVVTGEGQATESLVLKMIPGAVIAGYVRDANGDPVVGIKIEAVRVFGAGKTRRIGNSITSSSDDRGYYRLRGLSAGSYAVAAAGQPRQEIASIEPTAYPVTFYPGVTDPAAAGLVAVKAGDESPADLVLHAVPVVRIDGDVSTPNGSTIFVAIAAPSVFGSVLATGVSASVQNGKFTFRNIASGKYHLTLIQGAGDSESQQLLGSADVDAATNPSSVSISLAKPLRVSIHLTVTGRPKSPSSPVMALLGSLEKTGGDAVQLGPDGRGVFPSTSLHGRYTLLARQGRPIPVTAFQVKGAPQSGRVLDLPDTGQVEIEATADATTVDVAGRVARDGVPQPGVLVVLVQRDTWEQIGIYTADQSDSDGTFAWRDLPPGDYLAFALEEGEANDYDDADSLRTLLPIAQTLTLTGAPLQRVELKVLPLPAAK